MSNDIDVIITWVDGNDPVWGSDYARYKGQKRGRFRDLGVLKYIFRGIELNMPWVKKIHFVTNGQLPNWIDLNNPKLRFHKHEDFFIYKDALPVFNSNAIEMNFSNIDELAEKFIIFNDDTMILKPLPEERFFRNGIPVDYCKLSYPRKGWLYKKLKAQNYLACQLINNNYNYIEDLSVRNIDKDKLYSKKYNLRTKIYNFIFSFLGKVNWLEVYHHPQPHLKSTWLDTSSENLNAAVKNTIYTRFRSSTDISHYLFRYINIMNNRFYPMQFNDHCSAYIKNSKSFYENKEYFFSNSLFCICEDETMSDIEFDKLKRMLIDELDQIFPKKSSFEVNA